MVAWCCYLGILLMHIAVLCFLVSYRAGITKTLLEVLEVDFYEGLNKLLAYQNIISISGESGTGKTTLILFGSDQVPFIETWIEQFGDYIQK